MTQAAGSASPKPRESGAEQPSLTRFLDKSAVLDLAVDTKEGLLRTLAEVVVQGADQAIVEKIYRGIEVREAQVNTYVGNGVAIPHSRVDCIDGLRIALARNPSGFPYGIETGEPVTLVILVVGNETLQNEHVRLLGQIASIFIDPATRDRVLNAPDAAGVLRILGSFSPDGKSRRRPQSQLLLSHARKIAKEVGASAVVVVIESLDELKILKRIPRRSIFVVATSVRAIADAAEPVVKRVLLLPRLPVDRDARVRLTALLALTHGLIQRGDLVAFLSGREKDQLDTMTLVETGREFRRFVTPLGEVARGVRSEVLERTITLAVELSGEGREGSPVGALYVIVGDPEKLAPHTQQMVINPFRGYPEEERNVLDPTLAETMKEFASIDGAFVIRGDGVVLSAGTYLSVEQTVELPGGFGSRHRVACAVSKAVDCVAVTLSQSTGEITVFKQGSTMLTLPRAGAR